MKERQARFRKVYASRTGAEAFIFVTKDIEQEDKMSYVRELLKDEEREEEAETLTLAMETKVAELEAIIVAEENRVAGLKLRVKTMLQRDIGFPAFYKIRPNVPNSVKYLRPIITNSARAAEAEALIYQLEAEDVSIAAEVVAEKQKEIDRQADIAEFKTALMSDLDGMNIPPRVRKFLKYLAREAK